ncbi:MAG: hypothetical protein M1833_000662 [Piccolia ochrophora]|nr:MAG: hypothetical protein M1833_000662 [Piccolia ochrophora]
MVTAHLAARAMPYHRDISQAFTTGPPGPAWLPYVLAFTVLVYLIVASLLQYTYADLVGTLAIVEERQDSNLVFDGQVNVSDEKLPIEPEAITVKPTYITSSLRKTTRRLREVGGRRAHFRGIGLQFIYQFIAMVIKGFIQANLLRRNEVSHHIAGFVASLMVAGPMMAWTHYVISEPSQKSWYGHLCDLTFKDWKKIMPVTALWAFVQQLQLYLPTALYNSAGPYVPKADPVLIAAAILLNIVLFGLVMVPALVTLTRVQASLLPENIQTIVTFDRSFDGKVVPEILGGTGVLGMLDAWKTFDWASRRRLLGVYAKVFSLQFALAFCFVPLYTAEILLARQIWG